MLRLRVIQAEEGDCLLVMHGRGDRRTRLLIDGGPAGTFERHLRPTLEALRPRALDAVVLSHADNDHILGLRDLFSELRDARDEGKERWIAPRSLWINAFSETLDGTIRSRLASLAFSLGASSLSATEELLATADASVLKGLARDLGIAINPETQGRAMFATRSALPIEVGDLSVRVVGPTRANLDALRDEWRDWLDREEAALSATELTAALDRSVPNLSSLQLLVEADGRSILLAGDGRGDHLLDALDEQRLLDDEGRVRVDVLKLPHHGSVRNMPPDFFRRLIADTYVISANGRYDNPDRATLEALHDAAREDGRQFDLVVTNRAPSVSSFVRSHPPSRCGYRLVTLSRDAHHVDVELRQA